MRVIQINAYGGPHVLHEAVVPKPPVFFVAQNDTVRRKVVVDAVASGRIGLPIATRLPRSAAAEADIVLSIE